MRNGDRIKTKLGVWQCFERLQRENNPRLVALIERKDAEHLLAVRAALKVLTTTGVTKGKIANAKRLLATAMKGGET
jgi:hypothetical protein